MTLTEQEYRERMAAAQSLFEAGDRDGARLAFAALAEAAPGREPPRLGLAAVMMTAGDAAGAEAALGQVADPSPRVLSELGRVRLGAGRAEDAAEAFRRALDGAPDQADALLGLGIALLKLSRPAEAGEVLGRLVERCPEESNGWLHLGTALRHQGRMVEACESFRAGLDRLSPGDPLEVVCRVEYGMAALASGDLATGFAEYEWRLKGALRPFDARMEGLAPAWRGAVAPGRSILLWSEQGLGDTIHFLRYAVQLAAWGMRVHVMVPAALERLCASAAGIVPVVVGRDPVPEVSCQAPLMSIPHRLAQAGRGMVVPRTVPYITPPPDEVARWRGRIGAASGGRLAVGLVWRGNPAYAQDHDRSTAFADVAPLLAAPGVAWFSLQLACEDAERRAFVAAGGIDLTDGIGDFMDTAAAIAALDLVVSVDTSVIHCVGALGRPGWLLVPGRADWRWGARGEKSLWYPSLRLFRQAPGEGWSGAVARLGCALKEESAGATSDSGVFSSQN